MKKLLLSLFLLSLFSVDANAQAMRISNIGTGSITVGDGTTTVTGVTTLQLGSGLQILGTTGTASMSLYSPNHTYTASHEIDTSDYGGQANYNGTSLTATLPLVSATAFSNGTTALITNQNDSLLTVSSTPTVNGILGLSLGKGGFYNFTSNGTSIDAWGFAGYGTATSGSLAKFSNSSGVLANSLLSESATHVTVNGSIGPAAGFTGVAQSPAYVSGRFYMHGFQGAYFTTTNTNVLTLGRLYVVAGQAATNITIPTSTIRTSSSNASAGVEVKYCAYDKNLNLLGKTTTGTLIGDSATGIDYTGTFDSPVSVTAGIYYLGIMSTGTTGLRTSIYDSLRHNTTTLGSATASGFYSASIGTGYYQSVTYSDGCPATMVPDGATSTTASAPVFVFSVQ